MSGKTDTGFKLDTAFTVQVWVAALRFTVCSW